MTTVDKKRKSNRTVLYILIGIAVLVAALIGLKQAGIIGKTKATEVMLANAKRVTIVEQVSASGKVQPVYEVRISSEVSGEIREILIKEGDSVKAGQLLLRIRPDNLQSVLDRTIASLNTQKANLAQTIARQEQSKARLVQAEQDYARSKGLFDKKVISEQEWQTAKSTYEVAKGELSAANQSVEAAKYTVLSSEASVKESRENLALTTVYAPIDGVVTKLSVEKGERVVGTQQMAGTEIMRIANLQTIEVRVNVSENDIIRVSLGDSAIVDVDAYTFKNIKFKGTVTAIANSANATVGLSESVTEFEVRILIDRKSYIDLMKELGFFPFRPGMTASVEIVTDSRSNILSVPLASVTTRSAKDKPVGKPEGDEDDGPKKDDTTKTSKEALKEVVFVVEDGKAKMVEVRTGISDFDNIEIISGITEGQELIEGPFMVVSKTLKEGEMVVQSKKLDGKKE